MRRRRGEEPQEWHFAGLLDKFLNLYFAREIPLEVARLRGKALYYLVDKETYLVRPLEATPELRGLLAPFVRDWQEDHVIVGPNEPRYVIRRKMEQVKRAIAFQKKIQDSLEYSLITDRPPSEDFNDNGELSQ